MRYFFVTLSFMVLFFSLSACQTTHSKGSPFNDQAVADRTRVLLYKNGIIPKQGDIHVVSHNGMVTLSGRVDNKAQMDDAMTLVKHSAGVRGVANRIKVK